MEGRLIMRWFTVALVVLTVLGSQVKAGVLDLNRVLNVNLLLDSGNHNGGNGVSTNEVGGNQQFRQGINDEVPEDDAKANTNNNTT